MKEYFVINIKNLADLDTKRKVEALPRAGDLLIVENREYTVTHVRHILNNTVTTGQIEVWVA